MGVVRRLFLQYSTVRDDVLFLSFEKLDIQEMLCFGPETAAQYLHGCAEQSGTERLCVEHMISCL